MRSSVGRSESISAFLAACVGQWGGAGRAQVEDHLAFYSDCSGVEAALPRVNPIFRSPKKQRISAIFLRLKRVRSSTIAISMVHCKCDDARSSGLGRASLMHLNKTSHKPMELAYCKTLGSQSFKFWPTAAPD